ncbi:hypothetical protein LIER_35970 [Lithospermum erythrorhizon]|uniref:Uncharacterized protein n=1 Tax=Lithospermum erythrorhizon TaxID=34254 RepID=A0AAV3NYW2_LITER
MENPNPFPSHFEEEDDLEKLEESVVDISQQILDYRNTCPNQLKTTFAFILESRRPILQHSHQNILGSSRGSASESSVTEEDPEDIKKLELLKQKMSSNASAISVTLKRMRECMDKMDKLQSQKGVIHPAFKKKMPTD